MYKKPFEKEIKKLNLTFLKSVTAILLIILKTGFKAFLLLQLKQSFTLYIERHFIKINLF